MIKLVVYWNEIYSPMVHPPQNIVNKMPGCAPTTCPNGGLGFWVVSWNGDRCCSRAACVFRGLVCAVWWCLCVRVPRHVCVCGARTSPLYLFNWSGTQKDKFCGEQTRCSSWRYWFQYCRPVVCSSGHHFHTNYALISSLNIYLYAERSFVLINCKFATWFRFNTIYPYYKFTISI